jgi:minor extracellular serine protease Vpr
MVRVSEGAITVNEDGGKFNIDISNPSSWSYAKISVINQETGKIVTESITPNKNLEMTVSQPGKYWIEAKIKDDDKTLSAYASIHVKTIEHDESARKNHSHNICHNDCNSYCRSISKKEITKS